MNGIANDCRTKLRCRAWGLYRIPVQTSTVLGHFAMRDHPHGVVICQIHATQLQPPTGCQSIKCDIEAAHKDVMCASKQQGGAEGACRLPQDAGRGDALDAGVSKAADRGLRGITTGRGARSNGVL